MAPVGSGSVRKARMRMSDPQSEAPEGEDLVDACEEAVPAGAGGGAGERRGGVLVGVYGCLAAGQHQHPVLLDLTRRLPYGFGL
jgi:hypothetical protein